MDQVNPVPPKMTSVEAEAGTSTERRVVAAEQIAEAIAAQALTTVGFADFDTDVSDTMLFTGGAYLDEPSISVASDGATVTLTIEKNGTGDIRVLFLTGVYIWDTTPAATLSLTAGTDTVPVRNCIYIDEATKTLQTNTSGFPIADIVRVSEIIVPSAATYQTDGPYARRDWTDHMASSTCGHLSHLNKWIRAQHATYESGVAQTLTITPNGGGVDNVIFTNSSGVVLQLHDHTFPAFSGTPDVYVINNFTTAYTKVTDLSSILTDSTGASMSASRFSLVIWGAVSEETGECKLYCNLPSGTYNSDSAVITDSNKYANYTIPDEFKGTGFLISELKLRHRTASGGTWTSIEEVDLRGFFPSLSAGAGSAASTEFTDSAFRIQDNGDMTKQVAFEASGITTATTRTVTVQDADGTMAYLSDISSSNNLTQSTNVTLVPGNYDDWNLSSKTEDVVRVTHSPGYYPQLTGISNSQSDGDIVRIFNSSTGSGGLIVASESTGSSSANRIWFANRRDNIIIASQQMATFYYDGTDSHWVLKDLAPHSESSTVPLTLDDWVLSTVYAVGDVVIPTSDNDYYYECTTAGTSNGSEPTWDTTISGTTTDNTVTWTTRQLSWGLHYRIYVTDRDVALVFSAPAVTDQEMKIFSYDASTKYITIDPTSTDTIGGESSYVLPPEGHLYIRGSDTSNIQIVSEYKKPYASTGQTITSAALLTLAHGLGVEPKIVQFVLQCTSTDLGYAVGDRMVASIVCNAENGITRNNSARLDSTNIYVRFSNIATCFTGANKSSGVGGGLTNSKWDLYMRAFA